MAPGAIPLARNGSGPVPNKAAAWRVRRNTGGRPKLVLDANKQPMQFPLTYSSEDAEEILPPGTYRFDLVDSEGTALDYTVQLSLGAPPARAADEGDDTPTHVLPGPISEMRLVLEANIRAMQLAFAHNKEALAHNERTLTAGLRIAETLKEGVQSLAESQADCIKALVTGQMPVRIAAPSPQPLLVEHRASTRDEYEPEHAQVSCPPSVLEQLIPMLVPMLVPVLCGSPGGDGGLLGSLLSRIDLRSLIKASPARLQDASNTSPAQERQADEARPANERPTVLPPAVMTRLLEARAQLTTKEQAELAALMAAVHPDDVPLIAQELSAMSVPEVVAFVRTQLAKRGVA